MIDFLGFPPPPPLAPGRPRASSYRRFLNACLEYNAKVDYAAGLRGTYEQTRSFWQAADVYLQKTVQPLANKSGLVVPHDVIALELSEELGRVQALLRAIRADDRPAILRARNVLTARPAQEFPAAAAPPLAAPVGGAGPVGGGPGADAPPVDAGAPVVGVGVPAGGGDGPVGGGAVAGAGGAPGALRGNFAVIREARKIIRDAAPPLQWTAIPARGSLMSTWIHGDGVGPVPTNVNCWEAVLYLFVRAEIVDQRQIRARLPVGEAGETSQLAFRALFTPLLEVIPPSAAPGDVAEFVASSGYVGECQHVALVNGVRDGHVNLIELDQTRGGGRLRRIWLNDVLRDIEEHHGRLSPWRVVVWRFVDWP